MLVNGQTEKQTEQGNYKTDHQQSAASDAAEELSLIEGWQDKICLAARVLLRHYRHASERSEKYGNEDRNEHGATHHSSSSSGSAADR